MPVAAPMCVAMLAPVVRPRAARPLTRRSWLGRAGALAGARLVDYRPSRILERWPRGRRRRFAKPLYGPKAVSRVRIPPSPQLLLVGHHGAHVRLFVLDQLA